MKRIGTVAITLLAMLMLAVLACGGGTNGEPTPTATALLPTPTPMPSACEIDRDATQAAIYSYHTQVGDWPTADGQPGNIDWGKLVPDFMPEVPSTDDKCDWGVNSDPEGVVCLYNPC